MYYCHVDYHVFIKCDQVGSTSAQGANSSLVEFALRRLSAGDCHMTCHMIIV